MRKIYFFMTLSLDGFFEGPDHDLSWHNVDDEFTEFAVELLRGADLHCYGRRVYELMESYWPNVEDDPSEPPSVVETAHLINTTPKIVYSSTLARVDEGTHWKNVSLRRTLDIDEVRRLKAQPGKQIWVGGSQLASAFARAGLIDEYRFMIDPIVLGKGTPIFQTLGSELKLQLIDSRSFKSGNVLLTYRPAAAS